MALFGASAAGAHSRLFPNPTCGSTIYSSVTLTSNMDCSLSGTDGLIIGNDGVTVNLNGFTLIGAPGFTGIDNSMGNNALTIRHGQITGWDDGVFSNNGARINITDVTSFRNEFDGFDLQNSSNGAITGSVASGNDVYGADFENNHLITVTGSAFVHNGVGLWDDNSLDHLTGDNFSENVGDGVFVEFPQRQQAFNDYWTVSNSTMNNNGGDGVEVQDNSPINIYQAVILKNNAEFNGGWGFFAQQNVKGGQNGAEGNASGNFWHVAGHTNP
jgi:hypothetical protein